MDLVCRDTARRKQIDELWNAFHLNADIGKALHNGSICKIRMNYTAAFGAEAHSSILGSVRRVGKGKDISK